MPKDKIVECREDSKTLVLIIRYLENKVKLCIFIYQRQETLMVLIELYASFNSHKSESNSKTVALTKSLLIIYIKGEFKIWQIMQF